MKRNSIALFISTLAAMLAITATPTDASALGFDVNLKLKAGYQTAPEDSGLDGAFAYGAETSVLIGFIPAVDLTVGPYFGLNLANHGFTDSEATAGISKASVGGKVRFEMIIVVEAHGGYVHSDQTVESGGTTVGESTASGFNVGAFVGYGFPVIPALLQLEVGPYFDHYSLKNDDAPDDADSLGFNNFGVAIQGNFGF